MAFTVSQAFKTNIKDDDIPKSFLIIFDDLWFDGGDFVSGCASISQFFNTSDDLTYGDCPSDTLSFSVVANGTLAGYEFGQCRTYMGVQTEVTAHAFNSVNAYIEVGSYTWTASSSGLYCGNTLVDSGEYVSLISDGTWVYAIGLSSSYKALINGSNGSVYVPNRFMAQKAKQGISAVFYANPLFAYVWNGEDRIKYEYVPMGVYLVDKPRSTVGDVVVIQDAYDQMKLFDVDATEFISSLTYPITLGEIFVALCEYVGVTYVSATFTYSTTSYISSPFSDTSCTLRDILWWIAERARRVAHFNRYGVLELADINTTTEETLTADDIGADGYSIAEFSTQKVTGVLLKSPNGVSLRFGALDVPYVISKNPFISTITNEDLQAYWAIPTYIPIELNVLEADPSIDVGDMINVKPMVEEITFLTDVYGNVYVEPVALTNPTSGKVVRNPNTQKVLARLEAIAAETPIFSIPLMERQIRYIGNFQAKYVASGNEKREADISNTEYNADVAANMAVAESKEYTNDSVTSLDESFTQNKVFNRLTNNGETQGIYLYDGKIYINAEYIRAGTLSADYIMGGVLSGSSIDLGHGNFTVNGETGAIVLKKGSIDLGNGKFTVNDSGSMHSEYGEIGGFTIASNMLYSFEEYWPTSMDQGKGFHGVIHKNGASPTSPFIETFYDYSYNHTTNNPIFRLTYNGAASFGGGSLVINADGTLVSTAQSYADGRIEVAYTAGTNEFYGRLRPYGTSAVRSDTNLYESTVTTAESIYTYYGTNYGNAIQRMFLTFDGQGLWFKDDTNNDWLTAQYAAEGHYFFPWSVGTASSGTSNTGFFEVGKIDIYGNYQNEPMRFHIVGRSIDAMCVLQFSNSSTINGHSVANLIAYGLHSASERVGVAWSFNGSNFKEFIVLVENKQTYNRVVIDEVHIGAYAKRNLVFFKSNTFTDTVTIDSMNPTFATWK